MTILWFLMSKRTRCYIWRKSVTICALEHFRNIFCLSKLHMFFWWNGKKQFWKYKENKNTNPYWKWDKAVIILETFFIYFFFLLVSICSPLFILHHLNTCAEFLKEVFQFLWQLMVTLKIRKFSSRSSINIFWGKFHCKMIGNAKTWKTQI